MANLIEMKLDNVKFQFGKYVKEWESFSDDRRLFCNIYNQITGALEELIKSDIVNIYIEGALIVQIDKDIILMKKILNRFKDRLEVVQDEQEGK